MSRKTRTPKVTATLESNRDGILAALEDFTLGNIPYQADKLEALAEAAEETPLLTSQESLESLEKAIRRFVWFPEERHYTVAVLWAAYTHVLAHSPNLEIAPRLGVFSGAPGSGKTRALEILDRLCANGQGVDSMSAASMLRLIAAAEEKGEPGAFPITLFPDELDRTFSANGSDSQDDLTIMLNLGYRRGANIRRAHKDKQKELVSYPCFGPVAFAGLATARLPEALLSRTFFINTTRAKAEERPEPFFRAAHDPELREISTDVNRWARDVSSAFADPAEAYRAIMAPEVTSRVDGRDHELWACLYLVANLAGEEWTKRVLEALEEYKEEAKTSVSASPSMRLLAALRVEFAQLRSRAGRVPTGVTKAEIANAAITHDPATFSRWHGREEGISAEDILPLLKEYGVKVSRVRPSGGGKPQHGWRWVDLEDAWSRVLPAEDAEEEDPEEVTSTTGRILP